ncbi:hypothetical protein Tco_0299356 [Tanacetum coccineum]
MPYRIYEQMGRDDIMKEDRNITMINYTEAEVTGRLVNVLCQVGFTTLSAKFLILEIHIDRDAPIMVGHGFLDTIRGNIDIPNRIFTTFDGHTRQTFKAAKSEKIKIVESDSDDEEDYVIKRNDMGTPIHNSRPIEYQNNTNPAENMTLSTLESVINPFRKINVWKKAVSFLGSLPAKLRDVEWKPNYKLCYSNPELATRQWKTEIRLTDPYENIYMQAFVTKPTKRKLSKYHKLSDIMSPNLQRGCSREEKSRYNSRLETLLPKLICSPQIMDWQLLHKIGCGDEIDQMLKISLKEAQSDEEILFFVAWRLGLYHAEELNEEEWVCKYGMGDCKMDEKKEVGIQTDSQICCGQFISKIARKSRVLTEETICNLSTPVYCRDLDRTTLRELIDSEDRLILEIPVDDIPRVAAQRAPRVQRALMQDLYERMGSMEYKHAYHWDRYHGVFEHMAGVYSVPLQGAYNPPGYAQPQYDQYY